MAVEERGARGDEQRVGRWREGKSRGGAVLARSGRLPYVSRRAKAARLLFGLPNHNHHHHHHHRPPRTMIAPITGKLRKRLWVDLSTALGLGTAGAYIYW